MRMLPIFLTVLATLSLPARAENSGAAPTNEMNPVVNEGVILYFDKTLPLEENHSSKEKNLVTTFSHLNRICNVWVKTPAFSPAEIPAGARFLVHWDGKYMNLQDTKTKETRAVVGCYINGMFNFDMRPDHPQNAFTDNDASEIFTAHVESGSIKKPFQVGSDEEPVSPARE